MKTDKLCYKSSEYKYISWFFFTEIQIEFLYLSLTFNS